MRPWVQVTYRHVFLISLSDWQALIPLAADCEKRRKVSFTHPPLTPSFRGILVTSSLMSKRGNFFSLESTCTRVEGVRNDPHLYCPALSSSSQQFRAHPLRAAQLGWPIKSWAVKEKQGCGGCKTSEEFLRTSYEPKKAQLHTLIIFLTSFRGFDICRDEGISYYCEIATSPYQASRNDVFFLACPS